MLLQGTPFGRYQLLGLLGRGGMGEVWRAFDTATNRVVALKLLPPALADDASFTMRFRREAEAAASLNSPHVIPIHNYGEIDGRLYVDMRLIEGRDLEQLLADGPLTPDRAVLIVEQVAKALAAAHRIGLIHRDVKPSNVLVDDDDFAYLIDFGIARSAEGTSLTSTGSVIGTWHYMAPERMGARGADARADVYSLACVLYECLTGDKPYPGSTLESQIAAHLTSPPPKPSVTREGLSAAFDDVIARGMAKDVDERYATTTDLMRGARSAITNPIPVPAVPPPEAATQAKPAVGQPATVSRKMLDAKESQPPGDQSKPAAHTTSATQRQRRFLIVSAIVLAVALVAAGVVVVLRSRGDDGAGAPTAATDTVYLEDMAAPGVNPFMLSAVNPQPAAAVLGTDPAAGSPSDGGIRTVSGDLADLYAGSRGTNACDTAHMVTFLESHADEARATAGVFQMANDQVGAFLRKLTAVLLRTDTRVTDNGFDGGKASARQAVLESGTAVLVDEFGVPRVRCASGNPLQAPDTVSAKPIYTGAQWKGFSEQLLTMVRPSPTIIDTFILYDPANGTSFGRPRGGDGTTDLDDPRAPAPPPPTTTTPPPPPPTTYDPPATTRYTPRPTTTQYIPPSTAEAPAPPPTTPRHKRCFGVFGEIPCP